MGRTCDLDAFLNLHKEQLVSSGVPERFWGTLMLKLHNETFDVGDFFQLGRLSYDHARAPHEPIWTLQATSRIDKDDPKHIYLIDHAWTFRVGQARKQLLETPALRHRMANLLGLEEVADSEELFQLIFEHMWKICNTYSVGNAPQIEDRLPVWYVMDEIGSAVVHNDSPNCRIVPFLYVHEQVTYSLFFPIEDIEDEWFAFRDFAEGISCGNGQRKAALLPWKPQNFTMSHTPEIPGPDYYLNGHILETIPSVSDSNKQIIKQKYKVFTEYSFIKQYLTDEKFEIVESEEEADILWYTRHFKDFAALSETPGKFVNQFPFEYVLTIKDLLVYTCRRSPNCTPIGFPKWLPITYNLKTEIGNFVSYFQHREKLGLDNYWIVKPYNLARSLDTHITNNLNYIMRLPVTGPKIVQKYITNPVLFNRPECTGPVKFDIRYVILLKSVRPLNAYVYKHFFLRFANKPFELKDFDVYEKHFTVMNYEDDVIMKHMLDSEFKWKWEQQYPNHPWGAVDQSIRLMLREILDCAVKEKYPCGIFDNPQSRALYAADVMLEWTENGEIQPKILEINWTPDCKRACKYYPDFYNTTFRLLFLDEEAGVL